MRADDRDEKNTTATGTSAGTVRALFTLAACAGAGALIWAAQLSDLDQAGGFWGAMAVLVVAGFVLGLSQLLGGWTKWGDPGVPARCLPRRLCADVHRRRSGCCSPTSPTSGWGQGRFSDWSGDLGIDVLRGRPVVFLDIVPVIVGLVLAFSFDTTGRAGPRSQIEKLSRATARNRRRRGATAQARARRQVAAPRRSRRLARRGRARGVHSRKGRSPASPRR